MHKIANFVLLAPLLGLPPGGRVLRREVGLLPDAPLLRAPSLEPA